MIFVMVLPVLTLLPLRSSFPEMAKQTSGLCYAICPAGYHKEGDCHEEGGRHRCKKCPDNTYTEIPNTIPACLRCEECSSRYETTQKLCSFNSNVVCVCQPGYYNAGDSVDRDCQKCSCTSCLQKSHSECQSCRRAECLNDPECKRICPATTPPATSTTAFVSTAPIKTTTINKTTWSPVPAPEYFPWMMNSLVAVFFLLLLLFICYVSFMDNSLCWRTNKNPGLPVQDTDVNEPHSQPGSSLTTQTFNITEETPIMTLCQCPATPEHPVHINALHPDTQHQVARQEEQTEKWPAIILYAIIKEVPVRRWKEFLRLLSVADQQLERVELEAGPGLSSMERQYQMLRLWSQRSSSSLNDVFSALHYMDLFGCAQQVQESLEKLQWMDGQRVSTHGAVQAT